MNPEDTNPKLVSFLDTLVNPLEKVDLSLNVKGIFAFPEEMLTMDENNPNFFSYTINSLGVTLTGGKFCQREPTKKEILERLEDQRQKKKTKKGQIEVTPEEEEEFKKIAVIEEQEEQELQKRMETMDEQEKFYLINENIYKKPALKWNLEESNPTITVETQQLEEVYEYVSTHEGTWIEFTRAPTAEEEELVKLKKKPPKTLTVAELNPLKCKGWIDLKDFQNPGCTSITKRCKLEVIPNEDPALDSSKYNLQDFYILVEIQVSPALFPLVDESKSKPSELIQTQYELPKYDSTTDCIEEFRSEVYSIVENLAGEYTYMFGKDAGQTGISGSSSNLGNSSAGFNNDNTKKTITVQKRDQIMKRKADFLTDFVKTGKYEQLKEKLKRVVLKICKDKFQKEGLIGGVTEGQKEKLMSEINVFLQMQLRQTIIDIIYERRNELHEDLVIANELAMKEREKIAQNLQSETKNNHLKRLSEEYEMVSWDQEAEKNLLTIIKEGQNTQEAWYEFALYQLRQQNYSLAEEALLKAGLESIENKILYACLLIRRGRYSQALKQLRLVWLDNRTNTFYNTLIAFVNKVYLHNKPESEKYFWVSQVMFMKKKKILPKDLLKKKNINPFEMPNLKKEMLKAIADKNKGPLLNHDQLDEIQMEIIQYFSEFKIADLIDQGLELIYNKNTQTALLLKSEVHVLNQNYSEAIKIYNQLLEQNPENYDVIMLKAKLCYYSDKFYEYEENFLTAFQLKNQKRFSPLLRLGFVYLKRKSWQEAQKIFLQTCEMRPNSCLSWYGLGISCLRQQKLKQAEEAFCQANLQDPLNPVIWGTLCLLCLLIGGRLDQAKQCLNSMFQLGANVPPELLDELGDEFTKISKFTTAEQCYFQIINLVKPERNDIKPLSLGTTDLGKVYFKLGQNYDYLQKFDLAKQNYQQAYQLLEGESEKMNVKQLMQNLNSGGLGISSEINSERDDY